MVLGCIGWGWHLWGNKVGGFGVSGDGMDGVGLNGGPKELHVINNVCFHLQKHLCSYIILSECDRNHEVWSSGLTSYCLF